MDALKILDKLLDLAKELFETPRARAEALVGTTLPIGTYALTVGMPQPARLAYTTGVVTLVAGYFVVRHGFKPAVTAVWSVGAFVLLCRSRFAL